MLVLLMSTIALGGYASSEPKTKNPPGVEQNATKNIFTHFKSNGLLIAQATAPTGAASDYTDQNKKDSTGTKVVNVITTVLPAVHVDTITSPGDILKEGTYYVKSIHKGMNVTEILGLIFGLIGFGIGLYFYFRHKTVKDALAAAQSQLSQLNKSSPTGA